MSWHDVYFLPEEVMTHNTYDDCWIIIYGVVKNVSKLIEEYWNTDLVKPLLKEAGKDISYWFEIEGQQKLVVSYI